MLLKNRDLVSWPPRWVCGGEALSEPECFDTGESKGIITVSLSEQGADREGWNSPQVPRD